MQDARTAVESVFRQESGRIIATLIRISGSSDRAEEALQEALASALSSWPAKGIPQNPGAWITSAAHRKLIDQSRRERTKREKQDSLLHATATAIPHDDFDLEETSMPFPDDRLRLIFTCCHPALNLEGQVALTLRTLGGLSTTEIAKAFLLPESAMAQRLVRAKRKIHEARIPYEVPPAHRLSERLSSVQAVVYLIFNEGYSAASGDQLVRRDLCLEAIRLSRVLCELLPGEPENIALLALMLLHDSRRDARVSNGQLITLEEQDRSLWDQAEISEGLRMVEASAEIGTRRTVSVASSDCGSACAGQDGAGYRLAPDRGALRKTARVQFFSGDCAESCRGDRDECWIRGRAWSDRRTWPFG